MTAITGWMQAVLAWLIAGNAEIKTYWQ